VAQQESFFPQTVIAVIWDFDKTLIPGNMQAPLFAAFGVDEPTFWAESNALADYYAGHGYERISKDTIYLNHILAYVRAGIFEGLNNMRLRELGRDLKLYPGMPELLRKLNDRVAGNEELAKHGISVEHYVVSTGLRQTVLGSAIAKHIDDAWGCEFLEFSAPPGYLNPGNWKPPPAASREIVDIGYTIDNTTKTRAIFEINKGVNKHPKEISVNDRMDPERRRVPVENMIYIADGPSDVPVFSILRQYGGKTMAVYNPDRQAEFNQVLDLQAQGRVDAVGPADYREMSHTARCLNRWVDQAAARIFERRERLLGEHVQKPPQHLAEEAAEAPPTAGRAENPRGSRREDPLSQGDGATVDDIGP